VGTGGTHVEEGLRWVRAAVADGLKHPICEKLAALGASGKHPQNAERDLCRLLRSEIQVEPYLLELSLESSLSTQLERVQVGVLPIHEMLAAIANAGPATFQIGLLGPAGLDSAGVFWQHAKKLACYCKHPALEDPRVLSRLLPLMIHTDGAEVYNNREYYFWCWSSLLAKGNVFDTKFPIVAVPHACMRDHCVKDAVLEHITEYIAWSLHLCEQGIWPMAGIQQQHT